MGETPRELELQKNIRDGFLWAIKRGCHSFSRKDMGNSQTVNIPLGDDPNSPVYEVRVNLLEELKKNKAILNFKPDFISISDGKYNPGSLEIYLEPEEVEKREYMSEVFRDMEGWIARIELVPKDFSKYIQTLPTPTFVSGGVVVLDSNHATVYPEKFPEFKCDFQINSDRHRILKFLSEHPGEYYPARDIAETIGKSMESPYKAGRSTQGVREAIGLINRRSAQVTGWPLIEARDAGSYRLNPLVKVER